MEIGILLSALSYETAPMEVEPSKPTDPHRVASVYAVRDQGVTILYGRWLIERRESVSHAHTTMTSFD